MTLGGWGTVLVALVARACTPAATPGATTRSTGVPPTSVATQSASAPVGVGLGPSLSSGIEGKITAGPTPACHAVRVGEDGSLCVVPVGATPITVQDTSGAVVATVKSAHDGSYSVALPPGRYSVEADEPPEIGMKPRGRRADVTVTAGAWSDQPFEFDTGIR